jgi:hypothetical protein
VDRRLHSRVTADILGRSAISVLAEISEQTGVSLRVAPEDVATVGERKLSLFLHDCELKSVMVQIPEALRECHWDIAMSGEQPLYYLHRNAEGADLAGDSAREMERLRDLARAKRVERLEAVKRALAMSPEELRAFEGEDLFLARAMQDPENRAGAALFTTLPPEQLQEFVDDGRIQPRYADMSPELKEGFEALLKRMAPDPNLEPGVLDPDPRAFVRERIGRWRTGSDPRVDYADAGAQLGVGLPGIFLAFPIPPKFPTERHRSGLVSLLDRGEIPRSQEDADRMRADRNRIVSEWIERGRAAQSQEWDSSQQGAGQEPTDPALLQPVALRSSGRTELAQLQREIAGEAGLALLSDYFSERPIAVSGSLTQAMPLWRLLSALCTASGCIWRKTGSYLVFHHIKWSELAPGEIPESLLARYRQKVAEVGHLTIADAAEFAVVWEGRDKRAYGIPMDLQEAGLNYSSPVLLLYASLTPEQIAAARRSPGLACSELTMPQRRRLAEMIAGEMDGPRMTMDQALSRGHFRIEEAVTRPGRNTRGEAVVRLFVRLGEDGPRFPSTYRFRDPGSGQASDGSAQTQPSDMSEP